MSRKKRVKEETKGGNDAFVIMSNILDKLQIAEYDVGFLENNDFPPLNAGYFAYPLKSVGEQFSYFAALSDWLFHENNHTFTAWNDFDDPNSISNNILTECKKLGFHCDFGAVKLRQGSGIEVCQILDFLLNLLLKKIKYEIMQPIYHKPTLRIKKEKINKDKQNNNENNDEKRESQQNSDDIDESHSVSQSDDGSMAEDIIDSENNSEYQQIESQRDNNPFDLSNMNSLYDQQENINNLNDNNNSNNINMNNNNNNYENEEKTTMGVMQTSILPAEWKLELERVSNRLNEKYFNIGIKDWILHLNKTKLHSTTLSNLWPQCENKLRKSEQSLNKLLNRISNKENGLNHEFSNLRNEYKKQYTKLTELTNTHNEYLSKVGQLTSMLQDLNQQISDIKQEMENRNNAMTDMSPIRRLRDIHNLLKQEITQLDTKIGVTRHALQHARMRYEKTYSAR